MSDDAANPVKRGRKANTEKVEKPDTKKRQRKEVKHAESGDEDGVAPVKRGRGRPKGSTKKKSSPAKPKGKSGGRRGRPKKDDKNSAEEDNEENDAAEDEDD